MERHARQADRRAVAALRRRGQRGTAAVEMLLSVPILFLFAVAMLDFAKGYVARSQAERVARHFAWEGSRALDDGKSGPATGQAAMKTAHVRGEPDSFTVSFQAGPAQEGLPGVVGNVQGFLNDAISIIEGLIGGDLLAGMPRMLTGVAEMQWSDATVGVQTTTRLGAVQVGFQSVAARHYVALRAYRDHEHPGDPEGWFDPIARLYHWISDKFS